MGETALKSGVVSGERSGSNGSEVRSSLGRKELEKRLSISVGTVLSRLRCWDEKTVCVNT